MEFEENRAATKSPTPSSSDHSHDDLNHMIYVAMNSLTYFVLCLAVIFLLVLILLFLVFIWYWWLRPKINFSRKTVHYSAIHSDDDDADKNRQKSGYMSQRYGHDPVFHQLRASSQHHISQKSSKQWGGSIPVNPHMDINAGHLLLTYIEDNLKDKDRLDKEWNQLQTYLPDDVQCIAGLLPRNRHKNRYPDIIPYDHSRVKLNPNNNISGSDYINASYIVDVDPKHPTYIAAQSPMQHTISDFWQMVWEQNVSVVIMLTPLSDMGLSQSCQYWPTNGVTTYFDYEVHLVSEHHHTVDYIVRSFYIVNIKQKISRTVTQFHFQTWSSVDPLSSPTPLLEFRRKVRIAQTQPNTPLLVHCNDGVGRTGTYCLIDMTLSRITSGAKEINLAATVEHLRDQRPLMVKRKDQFEVALVALVEETERMLEAAAQRRLPVY